jgi:hypothetical protein
MSVAADDLAAADFDGADLGDAVACGGAAVVSRSRTTNSTSIRGVLRSSRRAWTAAGAAGILGRSSRQRLTARETLVPSRQGLLCSLVHLTSVERGR